MPRLPLLLVKRNGGLYPATDMDAEALAGYGDGAKVEAEVRQPRVPQAHRFFFAALNKVVASGATPFRTTDELLDALKMAAGLTELRRDINGRYFVLPGSISFAAKDEAAFREFREAAFAVLAERYGIDATALEGEPA